MKQKTCTVVPACSTYNEIKHSMAPEKIYGNVVTGFARYVNGKKGKAVPLHAMEAHRGRGGIAPTHS
jgi:hypothetical protein